MAIQTFSQQLILLPGGQPAVETVVQVYDTADTAYTTPLTTTDLNGAIISPLMTDQFGILPQFRIESDFVACVIVPGSGEPQQVLSMDAVEAYTTGAINLASTAIYTANNAAAVANTLQNTVLETNQQVSFNTTQLGFNVLEFGAVPDDTTDSTAAIQAAIDAAASTTPGTAKTVWFPGGQGFGSAYVVSNQINVPEDINLRGVGGRPWIRSTMGPSSGLATFAFVDEPALGPSPQEGAIVEDLAFRGTSAGHIYFQGVAGFRIRKCYFHTIVGPAIRLEYCQDAEVVDCDVFAPNGSGTQGFNCLDAGFPERATLVLSHSNNIYMNMWRVERPGGLAAWVNRTIATKFRGGKFDSNTGVVGFIDPYVLVDENSAVRFFDFGFRGIQNEAVRITETSFVGLYDNTDIGGPSSANAAVVIDNPTVEVNPIGFQDGTARKCVLELDRVEITAESANTANELLALVAYTPPDNNLQAVNDGVTWQGLFRIDIRETTGVRGGVVPRLHLQYHNGTSWVTPLPVFSEFAFDGFWITDMQTGHRARIANTVANGRIELDWPADVDPTSRFPTSTGGRYRIDYGPDDGVMVRVNNTDVTYRVHQSLFQTGRTDFAAFLTVASATYNAGSFTTDVVVDQELTGLGLAVGMYLYSRELDQAHLITAIDAGTDTITVEFDASDFVTVNRVYAQEGKLSDGNGFQYIAYEGARAGG